jgi:hypothetical protein
MIPGKAGVMLAIPITAINVTPKMMITFFSILKVFSLAMDSIT